MGFAVTAMAVVQKCPEILQGSCIEKKIFHGSNVLTQSWKDLQRNIALCDNEPTATAPGSGLKGLLFK